MLAKALAHSGKSLDTILSFKQPRLISQLQSSPTPSAVIKHFCYRNTDRVVFV
uniref:PEP2 n=1 Tax=Pieris brassicae granulosis virus TaxID=10465 RepID=A0A7G9U8T5_GVPB|nr:PEP2 [Pieris brassicae granulovirus]